ncbi:hypothetical protein RF11_12347 [Thelohanellus kitauei]|uniref:Uncharacterized protein n=1 Tax=Thelohanellus kitauei TaxID=669202 RepID=A0A0C2MZT7_THEKT|nr:hypothetical protein RF11_12347 [Thelohanellus kitauei]
MFEQKKYYKDHKKEFIDFFTTRSFIEIRMFCENELKNNFSIVNSLNHMFSPKLKLCAKTICCYSLNVYKYYAKRLMTYVPSRDMYGVVRIITTRAEIDLSNIVEKYQDMSPFVATLSIRSLYEKHPILLGHVVMPLLGLDPYFKI